MGHPVFEKALGDGRLLRLEALRPDLCRLRVCAPAAGESTLTRYGIFRAAWEEAAATFEEKGGKILLKAGRLALELASDLSSLRLFDGGGKELTRTRSAPSLPVGGGFDVSLQLSQTERLYGLGDVTRDTVQKRGTKAAMWVTNVASYVPIPTLLSSEGWGMVLATTWRHFFDLGATEADALRFRGRHGELDLYLFTGAGLPELLEAATAVTGRPTLLPLWAYGLTFVCNQQASARDLVDDGLNLRREGIPCDVIGLEPGWMSRNYDYGIDKQWHPERFYIPPWVRKVGDVSAGNDATFVGAVSRLGFKLSLWLCQDYDLSYEEERRAGAKVEGGKLVPKDRHPDDFEQDQNFGHGPVLQDKLTKPEVPWFEHLKAFVADGARAFKLDGALQVNEHPDRKWGNGMPDEEMHNLYPTIYNKQMALGVREFIGKRPLIYSSGGYAGIQQYSATWAGDTGGGAKPLISMINHGLSGHVNTSCDMHVFSEAGIHFGFFQPWSQVCSWAYWRHPWLLGDKLLPVFKHYARLRYSLLPYIYSTACRAWKTGMPILRGLPLLHPDSPEADGKSFQYYFGDWFLTGAFAEDFWLPPGSWVNYWDGTPEEGGRTLYPAIPEGRGGPLYVKEGALLPRWPAMDYVGQKELGEIFLDVYPGAASTAFTLYEDDGETFEYEGGKIATTEFAHQGGAKGFSIEIGARSGDYRGMPAARSIRVRLRTKRPLGAATLDGKSIQLTEDDGAFAARVDEIPGKKRILAVAWA
ncbi:MAG: glycoside hydrolase family 31 protein [Spirochaetes bacterium]|nr:glycoside hydrolase family 31 protein [Spirochaetota bacterium]